MKTPADILYPLHPLLSEADNLRAKSKALYREYLLNCVRESTGVANLAARLHIDAARLHRGLDGNAPYSVQRNLAHEVYRKLSLMEVEG